VWVVDLGIALLAVSLDPDLRPITRTLTASPALAIVTHGRPLFGLVPPGGKPLYPRGWVLLPSTYMSISESIQESIIICIYQLLYLLILQGF